MRRTGSARCPEGNPVVRYVACGGFADAAYCHDCSLLQPEQRCLDVRPAAERARVLSLSAACQPDADLIALSARWR